MPPLPSSVGGCEEEGLISDKELWRRACLEDELRKNNESKRKISHQGTENGRKTKSNERKRKISDQGKEDGRKTRGKTSQNKETLAPVPKRPRLSAPPSTAAACSRGKLPSVLNMEVYTGDKENVLPLTRGGESNLGKEDPWAREQCA